MSKIKTYRPKPKQFSSIEACLKVRSVEKGNEYGIAKVREKIQI